MLSILIPVYNQDVRNLAYTLAKQCMKQHINFQILCFDDMSQEKFRLKNRELASMMNINYTEMPENLGRSKIRNWLGKSAYFDYLLFLDGDSAVRDRDFIKKYLQCLPSEKVIYGGRSYQLKRPANAKKVLHWLYGKTRECPPAQVRNKEPYLNFQSNNFLIPRKLFEKYPFEVSLKGYGYEDLQYAEKLRNAEVDILHIQNPVFHEGLENNHVFLKKAVNALANLVQLNQDSQLSDTRLIRFYQKLQKSKLLPVFLWFASTFSVQIEGNLLSKRPSIWLFSLWKLEKYHQMKTGKFKIK
jgi:glycosyltransferase involved in cell wall biosynthesis